MKFKFEPDLDKEKSHATHHGARCGVAANIPQAKKQKQQHILAIIDLPEIDEEFPCNLDLTIADRDGYRQRLEKDAQPADDVP